MSSRRSKKNILSLGEHALDLLRFANDKRKASGLFNDVSIQVGNERFPCNKMVLSCYSTYFETMFKTETQETCQKNVELTDCEEKDIKMLIDYMYGEEVVIDDKNVLSTLAAADYLQIENVKTFCIEFLNNGLNIDNCLDAVKAYSLYMPSMSAEHIYSFISKNFLVIYKQEKFKNLAVNDLIFLLEELNKKAVNQEHLFHAITGWVANNQDQRKNDFSTLFQLIDLSKISHQCLKGKISNHKLVKQNIDCLNSVVAALVNENSVHLEPNNSDISRTKILCVGGNRQCTVMELHNISETGSTFAPYHKLPLTLNGHSADKVDNYLFCIGGTITRAVVRYCTNSAFRMNLADQKKEWKEVASMKERRSDHSSVWFKKNIVVSGGQKGDEPIKSVESYEIISDEWKQCQSMNTCRSGHAMTVCNNRLYALGGVTEKNKQSKLRSVESLSKLDGMWETGMHMNKARYRFAAVCLGEEIYAIGGQSNEGIENTVEKFVPEENKWCYVSEMNTARWGHAACVVNGKIFVIGGKVNQSTEVKIMESYDPNKNTWMIVNEDLVEELYGHSLVVVHED